MKKKRAAVIILSVTALLLLSAICALCVWLKFSGGSFQAVSSAEQSGTQAEDINESAALSELFVSGAGSENLLIYEGSALADMDYPEFIICGNNILFYNTLYSESDESYVVFYLFDPSDGTVTAESRCSCEFLTDIRLTDKGIMFADSALGYVVLLGDDLLPEYQWSFDPNYEFWYISADGNGLYRIDDNTLYYEDLENGTSSEILSGSVSLYGSTAAGGGVNITYIDEDQMSIEAWLDLESGKISTPDFDESLSTISYYGGSWFASVYGESGAYILGSEDDALYISLEDGSLSEAAGSGYILLSYDDEALFLYDREAGFISSCTLNRSDIWLYPDTCSYSETFGGFFILAYSEEGPELLFWDLSVETEGENLQTVSLSEHETVPQGSAADSSLYERAAKLGEEYSVEILIADQCETEYDDFTAGQEYDYDLISRGLDILEEALSDYPEGFFEQIKYDKVRKIQINLMGTMTPLNDNWGEEGYNGLTQESGSRIIIIFDLNEMYTETVYHEMSHAIDKKLEWDSYCRDGALYSEEAWQDLNPDGFEYEYVYSGFTDLEFEGDEYLYFIDVYSMVSPTEDRARIMEYAMAGYYSYFTDYEPTMAKLVYYSECIRDCFDTEGWPETTLWEEAVS